MKKVLRIGIIVIAAILVVYLVMCANFVARVKSYTKTSYGMYPYERNKFVSEVNYNKLSPYILIERLLKDGNMPLTKYYENSEFTSNVLAVAENVNYEWSGFSYAYFDFSQGGFVVVTPFDFEAFYDDGYSFGEVSGHCNRRVTINMSNGFWKISDITSDYEV